jgi:hypothetical protein
MIAIEVGLSLVVGPYFRFRGSSYLLGAVTVFWKTLVRNSTS